MSSSVRKSSAGKSGGSIPVKVVVAGIVILLLGSVLGYLLSGSSSVAAPSSANGPVSTGNPNVSTQTQASFDAGMQAMLGRLKSTPNDAALLVEIGNRYYDHQEWSTAVRYYRQALAVQPANVNVRTDMGTAIWYGGDAWGAVKEYKTALSYEPDYDQTLFNLGIVQWQGLHDGRAALKTWQTLLRVHPAYSDRQKVEQYMAQVRAELH